MIKEIVPKIEAKCYNIFPVNGVGWKPQNSWPITILLSEKDHFRAKKKTTTTITRRGSQKAPGFANFCCHIHRMKCRSQLNNTTYIKEIEIKPSCKEITLNWNLIKQRLLKCYYKVTRVYRWIALGFIAYPILVKSWTELAGNGNNTSRF